MEEKEYGKVLWKMWSWISRGEQVLCEMRSTCTAGRSTEKRSAIRDTGECARECTGELSTGNSEYTEYIFRCFSCKKTVCVADHRSACSGCSRIVAYTIWNIWNERLRKPIKYMEKGINEGDIKTFAKAFPNGVEGIVNVLPDDLSDLFPGYDVKLEIVDKEKLKKDEMTVILSDEYNLSAAELKDVTAAYILEVEMTAVIDGEEESAEEDIPVVKMDGEWVIPISMFW